MTDKTDVKTYDSYQAARGRFRLVDVPDMQYLMVDGQGDPQRLAGLQRGARGALPGRVRAEARQQA